MKAPAYGCAIYALKIFDVICVNLISAVISNREDNMKFKAKRKIKWIIALVVIFIIAVFIIFNSAIQPAVLSLAETKLKAIASQLVNDAVDETFGSGVSYSDLIYIEKDESGKIKSLSANVSSVDRFSSKISLAVQQEIENIGQQGIDIPVGTVIGGPLLTGRGPSINVAFQPVGVVNTEFLTTFENAGINQTRHLIYLEVNISMKIVVSNTVKQIDYSTKLLIADTVIVGDIPEQYMQLDYPAGMQSLMPMLLMDKYSGNNDN